MPPAPSSCLSNPCTNCPVLCAQTKAKLEEARERINGPVDPNTGRHLYRPEVGRGPKNVARNRDGMAIGEYLYVNGLEYLSRKEAQLEAERRAEADRANLRHSTGERRPCAWLWAPGGDFGAV